MKIVLFGFVSAAALAAPAYAAEVEVDTAPPGEEIVVEGQRPSYGAVEIVSATRTPTPVKDIPQALTVVTKTQIDDQQLRSIADLLTFVPGASPATGESNRDQFTIRGNNSSADLFVNGIRDDVQYFRDFYNLDRVEVLRGPNAMIFGRGGGGGIVNRVTKRTAFAERREAQIGGDSFGGFRLTGDIDQPLGQAVGLRVNALYENGDSFRRDVDLERYAINPTVGFALGADTRVDLSYEYLHDRRTADRGVPSLNDGIASTVDEPIDGFDKVFFGNPDKSSSRADVQFASVALEHGFGNGLTLRNRTMLADYD